MTDLSTEYLGLKLKNPLVASASPLTGSLESLLHLEQAGAAAVVLPSLFEEQIEHEREQYDQLHQSHTDAVAESLSYLPQLDEDHSGPTDYLRFISEAKESLCIPVIASLNGYSSGGWKHYAQQMEHAGADALELNIYLVPTDPNVSSAEIERHYCDLVSTIRQEIGIPIAVKLGPHFSAPASFCKNLLESGASGLVLFNRFLSPDIDLDDLEFIAALELSEPDELRLALRWIAIIRDFCAGSLAATGGVHNGIDAAKALLVGADVTMVASTLLRNGVEHLGTILNDLSEWLQQNEYESVEQMRGSMSLHHCSNPSGLKRANYMKALTSFTTTRVV